MTSSDKMPFGKHKGLTLAEVPKEYAEWLCKQDGFKEKNPQLYAYFTNGESASSTEAERALVAEGERLLTSMPVPFQMWWDSAYGIRLRNQGPAHYIPYLRVAIAAWTAADKVTAEVVTGAVQPKPAPPPPARKSAHPPFDYPATEDVPF